MPRHGDSLENNVIGYCLSSNNIVYDGYAKICSNFNSVPVAINLLAMVPVFGNAFNIKDRDIDVNTLNFPIAHNYNGNIDKSVRRVLVNTVADELWCADIVGNTGGCYTYASSVINPNSSFRPMLTLKPVGNNNQDGVFLNGMYELGTWDMFDNGGQRVTGYAEFLAILNNPNIMRLVADFGTEAKEIQLRQAPDGFLNYNSALSYFIPFREEFSGIPARNFRYPPEITISVSTPNMKTYSYCISMGPLISNAGGIKKYKIMQTKI